MPPKISSGTIPALETIKSSRQRNRSQRALSASAETPDVSDVPSTGGPSGFPTTPQQPLTHKHATRPGNENLETMDRMCEKHLQLFDGRIKSIEDALPGLTLAMEDSVARLAHVETSGANIDQVAEVQESLKELNTTMTSSKEVMNAVEQTLIPGITKLRTDLNKLMEETSTTRNVAEDQPTNTAQGDLLLTDTLLRGLTQEEPSQQEHRTNPVTTTARKPAASAAKGGTSHKSRPISKSKRNIPKPSPRSGVSRRHNDDNLSTSEDSDDEYDDHRRYDDDDIYMPVPFFKRVKGPKHPGLCSIKVTDNRYDNIMSYRLYRLRKTTLTRNAEETDRLPTLSKNLAVTFKDHTFNGEDPILIFDFLIKCVEEADRLAVTEGQWYAFFPLFLKKQASEQYRATVNSSRDSSITCWPEAVQYFLGTYATTSAIREANHAFRAIKQTSTEAELQYSTRVNTAAFRCGNVHTNDEKMTVFVDGLPDSIRTVVARFRDIEHRWEMTYERLVQFAKDEGDTNRARTKYRPTTTDPRGADLPTPRRSVRLAPPPQVAMLEEDLHDEQVYIQEEADHAYSVATSQLPSTLSIEEQTQLVNAHETILYLQTKANGKPTGGRVYTAHVPLGGKRVGRGGKADLICFRCYKPRDHILPKCQITLNQLDQVIVNYENLTDAQKAKVLDNAYKAAKLYFDNKNADKANQPTPAINPGTEGASSDQAKNG